MKITYHGHSAFRIETGGAVILVDPFFTGNPAAKASWQEASQGLTHLLLTHGHGDHLGDTLAIAQRTGASVFFKCENLQSMGAFKIRGAYNALAKLDAAARGRGAVAYSSGNHAQAVAYAARALGLKSMILMPLDAPGVARALRDIDFPAAPHALNALLVGPARRRLDELRARADAP